MKKINLFILLSIGIFCSSCSIQHTILNPIHNEIDNKIKPLLLGLHGDYLAGNATVNVNEQDYLETVFRRTLHENVFENTKGAWGYIDLDVTFNKREYRGYMFLAHYAFAPLFFFGLPIDMIYEQQIEIAIYNSNQELVKNYVLFTSLDEYINMYTADLKSRTIPIQLLNIILRDFESQINNDADFINKELEKSGKIDIN